MYVLLSDFHHLWIRFIKDEEDDDQHEDSPVSEDAVAHGLELPNQGSLDSIWHWRIFQDLINFAPGCSVSLFLKKIESNIGDIGA